MVWPAAVRELPVRVAVTGCPPSKVRVTRVIQRLGSPVSGWVRVMWFGLSPSWGKATCHHWPAGSGTKVPVSQLVSRFPSMAL